MYMYMYNVRVISYSPNVSFRILSKSHLAIASKTQDRDGQHSELTKIRTQQEDGRSELERQREVLYKLTQQINSTEQTLNRVRERERERKEERRKKQRTKIRILNERK